jgi:RNA polymerase sigma factor (sigma-70 family)
MRTEDGSIIYRCLNGESEAFGILVDKYKGGIFAFVHAKLSDFRDAQDVTQEVFVRAYRDLRSLRRWESFAFWLYRIASARCKLWIRTQSRRIDQDFVEDQDPKTLELNSMNAYSDSQASESIQESMSSLPEIYREVLMLHYFGGMTIKDMARAIGVSPGAIGMRLSRARAQLKEEMVAMMSTAFAGQKLQAGFTFRVVETVKRIKIKPAPRVVGVPWGLSLAAGIILTVMSLGSYVTMTNPMVIPTGYPLPGEARVSETGEIQVDILKSSQLLAISNIQDNDNKENSNLRAPQNAALMTHGKADTWKQISDMPTARVFQSSYELNGKLYVFGGGTPNGASAAIEEYDPKTDTWTNKATMPRGRWAMGGCEVGGKIYAIGGSVTSSLVGRSTVEEYDPQTDTWTQKTDMPTPRVCPSASVVDGKIYLIGGATRFVLDIGAAEKDMLSTVEMYDPSTDTWTIKSDMPVKMFGATSVVDGKIYAVGGDSLVVYDPVADSWVEKAHMPTPRMLLATIVINNRIYAIGGTEPFVHPWLGMNTVEEYDPETDTWVGRADMSGIRLGLSTTVIDGKIYAVGGATTQPDHVLATIEEYTPPGTTSVSPQNKLPTKLVTVKSD